MTLDVPEINKAAHRAKMVARIMKHALAMHDAEKTLKQLRAQTLPCTGPGNHDGACLPDDPPEELCKPCRARFGNRPAYKSALKARSAAKGGLLRATDSLEKWGLR